ncbi:Bacterial transcription activator, effector binding domain [Streptomyces sp. YIM 130001]|uniref:GyrI-like domain-containing protein n=1 Tax=Streptomyces sp. YIM 130001 TaxID=2259644 RepID=UPI000E65019F|nr:GyrI-like domain-containing protein [Streptomyces sp. YIM 130001]RII08127.1 Bacterial transcription activator, effector binding domain [Streptomyces sp. YIM 130001]
MPNQPRIEERAPVPFVGARSRVTWDSFGLLADRLPEIVGRLSERGVTPSGGPFFRYEVIDPSDLSRELQVVAGVPVGERVRVPGDDLFAGTLPGGRYVTVTHIGHPDELFAVADSLQKWARAKRLDLDLTRTDEGEAWGCRLESYRSDPRMEPDLNRWEAELSLRLRD